MTGAPVLIVDDNPLNTRLLQHILLAHDFTVECACDAQEALELLKTFRPRVILMDVQLPGMNGLDLTRLLKADPDTRHIQILCVSASGMADDERQARSAGCDGYIHKPIDTRAVAGQVRDCLERADAQRAAISQD